MNSYGYLSKEACSLSDDWRHALLSHWPEAAREAYFATLANAMLGGNGFEVFLEQASSEDIRGVVRAFGAVGAQRLESLSRIALAKMLEQGSAECLSDGDVEWMEALTTDLEFPASWHEIDHHNEGGTYALIRSELIPALDAYFARHRAVLVAG